MAVSYRGARNTTSACEGVTLRVVVTNDDGVHAAGILVLARALYEAGHEVMVVAPLEEASGSSAATGAWRGATSRIVPYEPVQLDLPPEVICYGLAALPALCVAIAITGALGPKPDCVASGINRGRNVGGSVLHSGTLGAALTAANLGCPAVAFSIETHRDEPHYETAAAVGLPLLSFAATLPHAHAVNLNVADLPVSELRGVRRAHIGTNPIVYGAVAEQDEIRLLRGLRHATHFDPDSDEGLTSEGYATVTIVRAPHEHEATAIDARLDLVIASVSDQLGLSEGNSGRTNR